MYPQDGRVFLRLKPHGWLSVGQPIALSSDFLYVCLLLHNWPTLIQHRSAGRDPGWNALNLGSAAAIVKEIHLLRLVPRCMIP